MECKFHGKPIECDELMLLEGGPDHVPHFLCSTCAIDDIQFNNIKSNTMELVPLNRKQNEICFQVINSQ